MHPILFTWNNGALFTYTTLFSIAILVGGWLWVDIAGKKLTPKPHTDELINAAILMLVAGLLGARALFVLTNWEHYQSGLFSLTDLSSGGIVFYGGAIGGTFALWAWSRSKQYRFVSVLSAATPALSIGHAIGRLGCLAHGCCYGKTCDLPWAISFSNPQSLARPLNTPLHPTQLYETLGLIVIFAVTLRENQKNEGKPLAWYLLLYGLLRLIVEFFRADQLRGALYGITTSQWISIGLIICSLFLDFRSHSEHNNAHENRT